MPIDVITIKDIQASHTDGYDRSGTYKASAGYYVKDVVKDDSLVKANGINLDRAILGAAENTTYGIFINAGATSYEAGPLKATKDVGSSGREGFSNKTEGKWNRTNIGLYVEGESDLTKSILVGAAVRAENYSDFGSDISAKFNTRIKIVAQLAVRGSVSRGFRAPSITQSHYSNYINISFDNAGNSITNPIIPAESDLAKLLGVEGLKKETSLYFRNYTYAQFGKAVLMQPNQFAWQIFDSKVWNLLYGEYKTHDASFVEADTMEELVSKLEGVDKAQALKTIAAYNAAVNQDKSFDPTVKDGKNTEGLVLPKSNWANVIDTPPFRAYPVTGGITFTYGGVKVNKKGEVLDTEGSPIAGLFACGEMVGGVFFHGYPGGSGLTSGTVFGRYAGETAALFSH